jgi:uncharacterized protein (TIGR02266 family)
MKRRFPRLTLRVDIEVESLEGCEDAVATTLGAGGLFVATDRPLPAHTPVVVRFRLPGEEHLLCFEAHVAWSGGPGPNVASPGMGLEFDDAEARARHAARLEQWAARNEAQLRGSSGESPAA